MIGFKTKDPSVINFVIAAGITGGTEFNAITYLVRGLKQHNLWDKIVTLYPFVGGTSESHKYNLINPQDTDTAFRITFTGGVTHDSNGITTNGTNGFVNTNLIPSTSLTLNNESMFLYSRTSISASTTNLVDMGAAVSLTQREELTVRSSVNNTVVSMNSTTAGSGARTTTNTDGSGLFMGSRVSSTDLRLYRNGSQIGTTATGANNGTRSNIKMYLGARNVSNAGSGFISRNYALAGCGLGFTSSEASIFYNIIQEFQTILGRHV